MRKNLLLQVFALAFSVGASAQTASFEIDPATLAAQVPPSKAGSPLPNCVYDPAIKLCAKSASVDDMIDLERGPKWFDADRLARLNKEIKKAPGNTDWLFQRAMLNIESHKFSEGLADLNQVLRIAPSATSALIRRAQLYTIARQYDRALADLDAAYYWSDLGAPNSGSTSRMTSLTLSADVLIRQGKADQARVMLDRARQASQRDGDGFQYAMLRKVIDRFASIRSGLNAAEMKELQTFLEVSFLHSPTCDTVPLLERAIAADFMAVATLNYLADLPVSCQSNEKSMVYAEHAVALGTAKAKALPTSAGGDGFTSLDLIKAYEARARIHERQGRFAEALSDSYTAYVRYDRTDARQASLARMSDAGLLRLAKHLPPEKVAAMGVKLPTASAEASGWAPNTGKVRLCNHTSHKVRLVLRYLEPGETYPATRGWFDLGPLACNSYTAQAGSVFSYHAIDSTDYSIWPGDSTLCVSTSLGNWTDRGSSQCDGNSELRPAQTVQIRDRTEATENLRPH